MSVVSVQRGFALPTAAFSSAAQRLLGALQDETIGAPVVSHLSPTFVADFTVQIALVAKLGADQSGAVGSVGSLVQSQAEAFAALRHLASVARRAARLLYGGLPGSSDPASVGDRARFLLGEFPRRVPPAVEPLPVAPAANAPTPFVGAA